MIDTSHRHEIIAAAEALAAGAAVIAGNYAASSLAGWHLPAAAQPYAIAAIVYLVGKIRTTWPSAAAEADAAESSARGPGALQPPPAPAAPAALPAVPAALASLPALPFGAP